jgi:hypothetical protein
VLHRENKVVKSYPVITLYINIPGGRTGSVAAGAAEAGAGAVSEDTPLLKSFFPGLEGFVSVSPKCDLV